MHQNNAHLVPFWPANQRARIKLIVSPSTLACSRLRSTNQSFFAAATAVWSFWPRKSPSSVIPACTSTHAWSNRTATRCLMLSAREKAVISSARVSAPTATVKPHACRPRQQTRLALACIFFKTTRALISIASPLLFCFFCEQICSRVALTSKL